ncbi:type II toxin-antitoxin system RelE/ParE family toxin [Acidithiobacillus caldus]|uniref:type II toxin-antitoxin system RelE/ParE family toxin n=1 Tax=Acidithiobacillus caldus TaxID=33059 RepID=UPI000872D788|nr:type II toxin-antitoxin system RelE/ParE family toxin [Acidithiobacillus caldus]OFC38239.1 plasmid stabilization protein [Acidithiobacillus caldus]OFC41734.1 plasmid stabilization protein [Acidithiobacillus caldus]
MPRVVFSPGALRDLQKVRTFLAELNPAAARRATDTIRKAIQSIASYPLAGRPVEDMPSNIRELVIPFGDSGYVARYVVDGNGVTILAIRHQREIGYH